MFGLDVGIFVGGEVVGEIVGENVGLNVGLFVGSAVTVSTFPPGTLIIGGFGKALSGSQQRFLAEQPGTR